MSTPEDVYKALYKAAERIGYNNYQLQLKAHIKSGKRKSTFRFTVTDIHQEIVDTMPMVLNGKMSMESAMALLHTHDAMEQRFV